MPAMTTEDQHAEPLRELHEAYRAERGQVQAPPAWRDDLGIPLKAADRAVKAAQDVQFALARVRANVDAGNIHRDQGHVQRTRIIEDARREVDGFIDSGRALMKALPSRVYARAWPDSVPSGVDWDTVAMEWESVTPDDALQTFGSMVEDALTRGDANTAKGLMSRRGRALLATRIGKELTNESWPDIQREATHALGRLGTGTDADPGIALAQVDAVERAFTVGANLADMMLQGST